MTLCPIALLISCKRCPVFPICLVKGIIGDDQKPASCKGSTKVLKCLVILFFAVAAATTTAVMADELFDINTIMMHWTFKIKGPALEPGRAIIGTVFVIGDAATTKSTSWRYTLVTAAHVLEDIAGEKATLSLRLPDDHGGFQCVPHEIRIRDQAGPLWTKHPTADIAVMYVPLPPFVAKYPGVLGANLLVDDRKLKEYEIHPGDELLCLGFPSGEAANEMGFPILRSGKIASFPLTPSKKIGSFLYDFDVFTGNSGGPVYFCQTARPYGGDAHLGVTVRFIAGLVIQQKSSVERTVTPLERGTHGRRFEVQEDVESLGLAIVVPAELISETLALLRRQEPGGANQAPAVAAGQLSKPQSSVLQEKGTTK